jgi:predicted enzyme related to lactoylglutathione lyase
MDPVQHFELPYRSRDRAKKFYFDAFGWQLFDLPGSPYSLASSVETHANGMPKKAGAINGGLVPRSDLVPGPTFMVKVGNLSAHMQRIREHGGQVLTDPVHMGPVVFVRFRDTEGNILAAFEDAKVENRSDPKVVGSRRAKPAKTAKPARKSGKKRSAKKGKAKKAGKAKRRR